MIESPACGQGQKSVQKSGGALQDAGRLPELKVMLAQSVSRRADDKNQNQVVIKPLSAVRISLILLAFAGVSSLGKSSCIHDPYSSSSP